MATQELERSQGLPSKLGQALPSKREGGECGPTLRGGFAVRRLSRQMGSPAWWQTVTFYTPEPWPEALRSIESKIASSH